MSLGPGRDRTWQTAPPDKAAEDQPGKKLLLRGVDTEFSHRVREAGYRLFLAPGTWVEHPAPATLGALLGKHFWYGVGYAQEVQRDRRRAAWRELRTPAHTMAYLLVRTLLVLPHAVVPWSYAGPSWKPGFKPLKALASYAAALGYVCGWYRHPHRPAQPGRRPASSSPSAPR